MASSVRLGFSRHISGVGLAIALLTGCGGLQNTVSGGVPQGGALTNQGTAHRSLSSSGDLLYVATSKAIVVVSYPQFKIVGSLPLSYGYSGICSDPNNGNVFVAESTQVVVYAHGGTSPIATLSPPSGYTNLSACSVDPTTDNLAVSSMGPTPKQGAILVFAKGEGNATPRVDRNLDWYRYPAYDNNGNLFLTCWTQHGQFHIEELPAGRNQFKSIKVNVGFSADKIQWDGTYLAFEEHEGHGSTLYQLQITGDIGTVAGSETFFEAGEPSNFWIQDGVLFNALSQVERGNDEGIGVWPYPSGGEPSSRRFGLTKGKRDNISDLALSVAPSR
jgi:hypothetical protein